MSPEEFRNNYKYLPADPGIYKYFDAAGKILYVGKAKNLKKRVSSYFNKHIQGYKTHELVKRIARIEFTVVDSEQDAFFLENALIKAHQPLFNIELKDDKSYPYIVIKNEPFPRVFLTRRLIQDGSTYLGPFTSVARVRELLSFVKQHVQLRTCKLNLTQKNIAAGKFKLCLEYHLGNCKGPCIGLQTEEDYHAGLERVKEILKGKLSAVIQSYKAQMQQYIEQLAFEKAELVKKKLEHLEHYRAKSVIAGSSSLNADVFTLFKSNDMAFINFLMVREGSIIQTHSLQVQARLDETDEDLLVYGISGLRNSFGSDAVEVIVPIKIDYPDTQVSITLPRAGAKKQLLDLSEKNVKLYAAEIRQRKMLRLEEKSESKQLEVLAGIQNHLKLPELPVHIECFDNSNFQGSYPVSAMVCFKNGFPSKQEYRKFNVKTVTGINDFASMKEAVGRRYSRLIKENSLLPQLVIIDGGKGQLSAAMEAIDALELRGKLTLVGLAKNVEEIFFPGDKESVKLPFQSDELKLIRHIRDEVHRFGITFHRQKRSKGALQNSLDGIAGIGPATRIKLLSHFKSMRAIKEATIETLAGVVGKAKAAIVFAHFQSESEQ